MEVKDLNQIRDAHEQYWNLLRPAMRRLTKAYACRSVSGPDGLGEKDSNRVITPDGYSYVESYVGSLFAKRPALSVTAGPEESGDPHLIEGVANRFLYNQVENIEDLVRFALVYPFQAVKLGFVGSRKSVLDRVDATVVRPWDIIVDTDAPKWELQRYVGHRYWLPLPTAVEKFGNKDWKPSIRLDYLEASGTSQTTMSARNPFSSPAPENSKAGDALSYVEIVEMYDLLEDEFLVWTPNLTAGANAAKRDQGGGFVLKRTSPIPIRDADGSPLPPIVPLYMSHDASIPLRGASTLARVYDALMETNALRTNAAQSVRRNSRMYLAREGVLSDNAKEAIRANEDQTIVEVAPMPQHSLSDVVVPMPTMPMSPDYTRYQSDIRADLERGSILAPFTRGQATNATATEIQALTTYTASEVGRMARRRDIAVENMATVYIRMMQALLLDDDSLKQALTIDGQRVIIDAESISGSHRFAAADQSSTPVSATVRRQRILELVPLLQGLGVAPEKMLAYIAREFELPPELTELAPKQAPPGDSMGIAAPSAEPGV